MPSSACALPIRSEEHTSELQSHDNLVCRLLLEKKHHNPTDAPQPTPPPAPAPDVRDPRARREQGAGGRRGPPIGGARRRKGGCDIFFLRKAGPPSSPPFPRPRPSPP